VLGKGASNEDIIAKSKEFSKPSKDTFMDFSENAEKVMMA